MTSIHYAEFEYMELNKTEKAIIDYIDRNIDVINEISINHMAEELYISKAQIISLCKKIGFNGYVDMKKFLSNNLGHEIIKNKELPRLIDMIENIDSKKLKMLFEGNQQIICLARGNSYSIAKLFSQIFSLKGYNVFVTSAIGILDAEIYKKSSNRLFVVFTHSGNTISLQKSCRIAKNKGDQILLITGNENAKVATFADMMINYGTFNSKSRKYDLSSRIEMHLVLNKMIECI